jgi:CelD/BcsL family acetyltransferase involved in cellulose biosynthesis
MNGGEDPHGWAPIEVVRSLASLREEWDRLAESTEASIFGTWEWADAWWRAYGAGHELALHLCRDASGRLRAVLPLYVRRTRGLKIVRFLGHGPGDELGPLHAAAHRGRAASALVSALAELDADVLAAEQLPGSVGWPELLGSPRWRLEASPALTVPDGGWEEFLAGRSANLRQQIGRRTRALDRAWAVRYRLADAQSLERDLDTLFALHAARWAGSRSDFADTPFQRDIARRAFARGWLRLWVLELDGRPAAAWHGFQVGNVASYYQAGRDPAFDREAVGFVLLAHTIREAMAEGAREYRFGRGDEPFKSRFADGDAGLETVLVARTRRGRAALRFAIPVRALHRLARRRVAR